MLVPVAENLGIALENIYVLGEKIGQYRTFEEMVEDARLQAIASVPPSAATKDTLACLLFSSGTTGLLKGWLGCTSLISLALTLLPSRQNLTW